MPWWNKFVASGMADSVVFDARYFNGAMLTALIQSAAVVVLPYDSTDQVSSGALADAIAAGRPAVATAFPARGRSSSVTERAPSSTTMIPAHW